MANQESKRPVYKDHLTAWRPDYPVMWNKNGINRCFDLFLRPIGGELLQRNYNAFSTARDAIAKCIGQC